MGIRILGHFRYPNTPRFARDTIEKRYIIVSLLGYSNNPNPRGDQIDDALGKMFTNAVVNFKVLHSLHRDNLCLPKFCANERN